MIETQVKNAAADLQRHNNNAGIEGWRPRGDYKNPPPLGITVDRERAKAPVFSAVDSSAAAIRGKLGRDAAGAYHWDKLNEDQQNALLDAHYNAPGLVGNGLVSAIRAGDKMRAFWELGQNVQDPNARRQEEARAYSPVENLLNTKQYSDNLLNAAADELRDAGYPVP